MVFALVSTSRFVILAVHGILSILRINHISAASSLSCMVRFIDHVSLPYSSVDHTYVFRNLSLEFMPIRSFVKRLLNLVKAFFAIAILFVISVLHLASEVMVLPKYTNLFTCVMFFPLIFMVHCGGF